MKKSMIMRITSICMALLFVTYAIPIASAVEIDSPQALSDVFYLQRDTGVEAIRLADNLSETEKAKIRKNLSLYGNVQLSESEVARINQEAAARGGLVYGSWFGGVDQYYAMSTSESVAFTAALTAVVAPFLAEIGVISISAAEVAGDLTKYVGFYYAIPGTVKAGSMVDVTMKRQYREVSYSDGTFAYYQTGFFAQDLTVAGKYYGTPEAIYSGGLW